MAIEKKLAKIESVSFGLGGYQDVMLGLSLTFSGDGWGVGTFVGTWGYGFVESPVGGNYKWTEADRTEQNIEMLRLVAKTLKEAKVDTVDKLKGIPVEVTLEDRTLKDWRVLTEVI